VSGQGRAPGPQSLQAGNRGTTVTGPVEPPSVRLLRLWLVGVPLAMLVAALAFAGVAAAQGRWPLMAVLLALAALGLALAVVQGRLLRRALRH
jgi:fatty acid desaturase